MTPPAPGKGSGSPRQGSLDGLLAAKEIAIACGPGGVGKTTTAAAAAATAACHHGGRVLVVTVDPARRLADALGLSKSGLGNKERRIPDDVFRQAGATPRGELWAAMLDTKESWDALVRRHAPDAATREQILANPLYRNIAGRFVQSHDYIAMERLYDLHAEGRYDLIVVDTPPTRNALDFLDAPQRMADFFSSRLLRWLIVPYRSRLVNLASRPFYQVADRILGTQFLADIAEFFILFQSMYDGFVERADAVTRLLADQAQAHWVTAHLGPLPGLAGGGGCAAAGLGLCRSRLGVGGRGQLLAEDGELVDRGGQLPRQAGHRGQGVVAGVALEDDAPGAQAAPTREGQQLDPQPGRHARLVGEEGGHVGGAVAGDPGRSTSVIVPARSSPAGTPRSAQAAMSRR